MGLKRWQLAEADETLCETLAAEAGIHPFLARLLVVRGVTDAEEAEAFLYGRELTDDPFAFADMDAAVDRITEAIENREKILVFGDYDADGVTATVLLYTYLRYRGADVSYRIPQREGEGYGLHPETVEAAAADGVRLIVTVDNGIAAVEEAELASRLGMDLVVTDHHIPQETLPKAVAVVNPHRTDCGSGFKEYAGVGVAFMLVCALEGDPDWALEQYAELVAIGTLADMMVIKGENRVLVRAGLEQMNRAPRCGIRALLATAGAGGKPLTSTGAVFTVAPRINAAGRMGYPQKAAELLLCTDEAEAERLAAEVDGYNTERQQTETALFRAVVEQIEAHPQWLYQRILVIGGEGWHPGVVGILAARVLERYGKPCLLLSVNGDQAKGSGRSLPGFSLFEAIASCSDLLTSFGGHELAAGVGLPAAQIDAFRERINAYAAAHCPQMPQPTLTLDCKLAPQSVHTEILDILQLLEPFGAGNTLPVFGLYRMRLEEITPVGGGKHLRLTLSRDGARLGAMWFRQTEEDCSFSVGDTVHVACTLDRNEFRGTVSVTVIVRDMVFANVDSEAMLRAETDFCSVMRGECPADTSAEALIPTREQMAALYRLLKRQNGYRGRLDGLLVKTGDTTLTPSVLRVAMEVLREAQLCRCELQGDRYKMTLLPAERKADLGATPVMRTLKRLCGV